MYKAGKLEPSDRKAFFFSAHEMNVAAVAKALELDEPVIPAYGSTIILETLRDKKGTYYVRVNVSFMKERYTNFTVSETDRDSILVTCTYLRFAARPCSGLESPSN